MAISVVYWSGTGNTQAMAEETAFALGCPSMGAEETAMCKEAGKKLAEV